jgi:hypothetical protein
VRDLTPAVTKSRFVRSVAMHHKHSSPGTSVTLKVTSASHPASGRFTTAHFARDRADKRRTGELIKVGSCMAGRKEKPRGAAAKPISDLENQQGGGSDVAQGAITAGQVTMWRVVFSVPRSSEPCDRLPSPPSVPPKVLETVGRHLRVPDRVLYVLMPEVVLQGPRVVAIVGELEPAGMAKHVGVDREWHVSGFPEALEKPVETDGSDWPAALGNENVGVFGVVAA